MHSLSLSSRPPAPGDQMHTWWLSKCSQGTLHVGWLRLSGTSRHEAVRARFAVHHNNKTMHQRLIFCVDELTLSTFDSAKLSLQHDMISAPGDSSVSFTLIIPDSFQPQNQFFLFSKGVTVMASELKEPVETPTLHLFSEPPLPNPSYSSRNRNNPNGGCLLWALLQQWSAPCSLRGSSYDPPPSQSSLASFVAKICSSSKAKKKKEPLAQDHKPSAIT